MLKTVCDITSLVEPCSDCSVPVTLVGDHLGKGTETPWLEQDSNE